MPVWLYMCKYIKTMQYNSVNISNPTSAADVPYKVTDEKFVN